MTAQQVLREYFDAQHMMQLATGAGDQPWICTVYYIADENYDLYWASLPTRRHSQEILHNPKAAAAIPVKFRLCEKVAGVQIEGKVQIVEDPAQIRSIAQKYAAKFGRDSQWVEDFSSLKTDHRLYKLTPSLFVLFDEVNFPDDPRQEFKTIR